MKLPQAHPLIRAVCGGMAAPESRSEGCGVRGRAEKRSAFRHTIKIALTLAEGAVLFRPTNYVIV